MLLRRFLILLILLLTATAMMAQTTGGIIGDVTGSDNSALPGVTIEAKSAALQGTRVAVSGPTGGYRFTLLPPGEYTVTFSLEGFAKKELRVTVNLAKEVRRDVILQPAASAEIIVSSDAPLVDTNSTA